MRISVRSQSTQISRRRKRQAGRTHYTGLKSDRCKKKEKGPTVRPDHELSCRLMQRPISHSPTFGPAGTKPKAWTSLVIEHVEFVYLIDQLGKFRVVAIGLNDYREVLIRKSLNGVSEADRVAAVPDGF